MIGYKATDLDGKCIGFQFEIGKTYKKEEIECGAYTAFHFCREVNEVLKYYDVHNSRLFEVIAGDVVKDGDKYDTNEITLIREIKGDELEELIHTGHNNSGNGNTGSWNSGNWNDGWYNSGRYNSGQCNSGNWNDGHHNSGNGNTGSWNSGNWNSGRCNSGSWNSGNWNDGHNNSGRYNSGNWNLGDYNSGFFNIDNAPLVRIFGKETEVKREDINFPDWLWFDLNTWVEQCDATEEEKKEHAREIDMCGGFIRTLKYKEAFTLAYKKTTDDEKRQLFELPNFDCDIFTKISGAKCKRDFNRLMKKKNEQQ